MKKHLKEASPHLSYYLDRLALSPSDIAEIEEVFSYTLEQGGLLELDYKREEGQSFNPRPARVTLIGINDAKLKSVEQIKLLLLSSILDQGTYQTRKKTQVEILKEFSSLKDLEHLLNIINLDNLNQINISEEISLIFLASFLDRLRHAHLADENILKYLYLRAKTLPPLTAQEPRLIQLIAHWIKRIETTKYNSSES